MDLADVDFEGLIAYLHGHLDSYKNHSRHNKDISINSVGFRDFFITVRVLEYLKLEKAGHLDTILKIVEDLDPTIFNSKATSH